QGVLRVHLGEVPYWKTEVLRIVLDQPRERAQPRVDRIDEDSLDGLGRQFVGRRPRPGDDDVWSRETTQPSSSATVRPHPRRLCCLLGGFCPFRDCPISIACGFSPRAPHNNGQLEWRALQPPLMPAELLAG